MYSSFMGGAEQGDLFAGLGGGGGGEQARFAVDKDECRVQHEIHRLMGLLRFAPDEGGVYTARCEPDNFILPALGAHFKERFGATPWAIIDEKRRLCIRCLGGPLEFFDLGDRLASTKGPGGKGPGEWEGLWRRYFKAINNESRYNPKLQKQFMPRRYWKYITELNPDGGGQK